ncbi:hypothetical protein EKN06_12545 [Croceicoccus ponticola]|uniref:Uncharacterized protein n=1 Tax=Croceicoccus ponticola TaxID=2217664 RepID=A0A437GX97_9SPHN|nr:hypothetical protein [Croceicoccus ponticola]RVQ65753.1 hypothetical protein EKN06_12545 [Croceicoccus ponticola]
MTRQTATRDVTTIRVNCPISATTAAAIASGDHAAVDAEPALAAMRAIVAADNPLGDFGLYRAVFELSLGWELFTPATGADPTLGAAGQETMSPTAILSIHVDAAVPDSQLDPLLNALIAAHPWEVPVIELGKARLLLRA